MRIGIPRETKDGERRVGIVPGGVRSLVRGGHEVIVEREAGVGSGFADGEYRDAGAQVVDAADAVWECPLIVKVKEVQRAEYSRLRPHSTILGFAQLNRDPELLDAVLASGARILACETVRDGEGALPLLAPMSRIAGRLAPLAGAQALHTTAGGDGTLVMGIDDVAPAKVVVLGAGNVGGEAARIAARLGCDVTVFSRGTARLERLARALAGEALAIRTERLDDDSDNPLPAAVAAADLVIGAVLEPGTLSPKLLTRAMVRSMRRGTAIVDVGIDQGGIAETSRMTTLTNPTYVEEGVVHYAVPNMPALVARTATCALAAVTLPRVCALADLGVERALDSDPGLAAGVMVWEGAITHPGLASDAGARATDSPWRTARTPPPGAA